MRLLLPGIRNRKKVDGLLMEFFVTEKRSVFRQALALLSSFYKVKMPSVTFHKHIRGDKAGRCYEDGSIKLLRPAQWKLEERSDVSWVRNVYHEWCHYIFWVDAERKAALYESKFVEGLRQ